MKTLFRSFAGGEITPELYGRLDLTKYQTGLAKALNFHILPHGPAQRRPGYRYVAQAHDSAHAVRLIPFAFSATQTVVLEFGHNYIGFKIGGETLLEADKVVVSIAAGVVTVTAHGWSTGDVVYMGSRFLRITVTGADTYTTQALVGGATVVPTGATAARAYRVTTTYTSTDLFDLHYAQNNDVLTITHPGYATQELRRLGATNWTLASVSFAPSGTAPAGVSCTATVAVATNLTPQHYVVTSVDADGVTESLAGSDVTDTNNLTLAGNYNTIAWSAAAGAARYNVYKQRGGSYGYIGQTTGLSLVDDNITADTSKTPPEDIYTLNTAADEYPSAVTYHEQRRWFAGTNNKPQNVWATRNGTESNLTSSLPAQEDDGLEFRIAARQQNAIRHLLPLSDLIALTVGGEFRIYSDNAPNITPSSLTIKPQGYSGASNVQPALTNGSILFAQANGSRIRELAYNWQNSAYSSIDISIMAPHLFNGYSVVDMAFVRAPVPTLWVVRSDGILLGMTYVPEQQVYAWHQHSTDGQFESVCVVSEDLEDTLYAVVRRAINGSTVRYIERQGASYFDAQEDAFFVDSGLTYDSTPVSAVSGLWHLEGETVQVLTDGAVHPDCAVTGGSITLDYPASVIHVGLQYSSDLTTLPISMDQAPAGGQGTTKNVNKLAMRVTRSSLIKAGPSYDNLTAPPSRAVTDVYGLPPALRTEEIRFAIGPSWNSDGAVCVRQDAPLPLTVLSIAAEYATGG